jgi:hypothetical protein
VTGEHEAAPGHGLWHTGAMKRRYGLRSKGIFKTPNMARVVFTGIFVSRLSNRATFRVTASEALLGQSLAQPVELLSAGDGIGHCILPVHDNRCGRIGAPDRR